MICTNCGQTLPDNAKFCSSCGTTITSNNMQAQTAESGALAICAIVFAILAFPFGYMCGVLGYYLYENPKYKKLSKIGLIISLVFAFICFISSLL